MGTSQNCSCQCLCPCCGPLPPHISAGDPSAQQVGLVRSPVGHCSFPLGPGTHKILCVPSKSGVSVYPSRVEVPQSKPAGLQGQVPRGFPVPLSDLLAGKPDVRLRTFTSGGELLWCYGSLVLWVTHLVGMGFDFIMVVPLLLFCCSFSFVFERGVSFFWLVPAPLSTVVQQLYPCSCRRWGHVLLLCHLEPISLNSLMYIFL